MSYVPLDKDRLGARVLSGTGDHAENAGVTAIPANESVLIVNWLRNHGADNTSTGLYFGLYLDKGGTDAVMMEGHATGQMAAMIYDGAAQYLYAPYVYGTDSCYAILIDRDNTKASFYLDGVLQDEQVLSNDPDLTATLRAYLFDDGGSVDETCWRCAWMSITNGSCPTATEIAPMLKTMVNPDAAFSADLLTLTGTSYSDYRPGEGVYGTATVTDDGSNGDDLTWQDGVTIEDVRVRAKTPQRTVVENWYEILPGASATTGAVDFGFTADPIVMRIVTKSTNVNAAGASQWLSFAQAGGESITVDAGFGFTMLSPTDSGFAGNPLLTWPESDTGDLDLFYVQDGTAGGSSTYIYCNGQLLHTRTITNLLSLAGAFTFYMEGRNGRSCRAAIWNPTSIPATLVDEIRACVMNPEIDPPSLTLKRVDFPLNETTLPLATSTTVANKGLGGGTLTLSAQRSTSCKVMLAARS